MLEARNISAWYDRFEVLRDVSFYLNGGTVMAILGPNGAGKTSLLKTLNRTLPVGYGEVLIDQRSLLDLSRREIAGKIAVVAQENETKFPISVREFVLAGRFVHGGVFGWEDDEDVSQAAAALDACDLGEFADRMMSELSGGERQRAVFARALASGANVLLLDEPTSNLDLAHEGSMFRLVRKRCNELGHSAIAITHDLNLAAEFAESMMLLHEGRVFAFGTPEDVLTTENINAVYGVDVLLDRNPASGNVRITKLY